MNIEREKFEKGENPDKKIRQDLEAEGWQLAGHEATHMTPFDSKTGRFDPKEVKSAKSIEKEFLDKYSQHGFTEIKLVRPYVDKGNIVGWIEDEYAYDVYMRKGK